MRADTMSEEQTTPAVNYGVIPLDAAIVVHGKTITELVLKRPPKARLAIKHGLPFVTQITEDGGQITKADTKVIALMLEELCDIPMPDIDELTIKDLMRATEVIAGFF